MRTRQRMTIPLGLTLVALCGLVGCATTGSSGTTVVSSETGNPAVEDVVRMPTSETLPEDVPDGLLVAEASPEDGDVPNSVDGDVMAVTDTYRIGPTDVLGFRSFDDSSLDTDSILVRHDGHISLPWIPDLKVAGLTREEATEVVRTAYQDLYFEAEVSLQVLSANSRTYTVIGDVNQPAEFPYVKPISLLDAIISAGSLRVNQRGGDSYVGGQGQLVKAFIIRGDGESRDVTEYDLRGMETGGNHPTQTMVYPGDIVYIPEGLNLVYLLGAVGNPGVQPLSEGITMLQLLATAGGFNESAGRLKQVVLIREINETETEVRLVNVKEMLRTGSDILIHPGDIVYVPRKRLVNLGEFVRQATGVVTPLLGITSQAVGLYTQVWNAFYQEERIDLLYNSDQSNQLQTNLELLEALRQLGSAASVIDAAQLGG